MGSEISSGGGFASSEILKFRTLGGVTSSEILKFRTLGE